MKTLTEFTGTNLKLAAKTKHDLVVAGKTPEELPQAMGEALKLEGDKLGFLMSSLEIVGTHLNDLKRVVVFTLAEGEKAPAGVIQKENHTFSVEYYPPIAGKNDDLRKGNFRDDGKGGKQGGKRGKGRGGRPDQRGPKPAGREPRAPMPRSTEPKAITPRSTTPPQKIVIKPNPTT